MFDITLSTRMLPGYNRFSIKIVQTFHIPGHLEPMEAHAFMLTPHPMLTGKCRKAGREKFEALINSHTDPALTSFLKDGSLFPLSQLGAGASPASRAHCRQEAQSVGSPRA
jgi:hypothetical protein